MNRIRINYDTADVACGRTSTSIRSTYYDMACRMRGSPATAMRWLSGLAAKLRPTVTGRELPRAIEAAVMAEAVAQMPRA